MDLNQSYWNNRYLDDNAPWDTGAATTPLATFFDQLADKNNRILIPGAGLAHEAAYLFENGFQNVFVCDWAEAALTQFSNNYPTFPKEQLICGDFFKVEPSFDLIVEQTFFCALPPTLRTAYVQKMSTLLTPKGILAGLFFAEEFDKPGPPFGGTKSAYTTLFSPYFDILEMELTPLSIKPRAGTELFFRMQKK